MHIKVTLLLSVCLALAGAVQLPADAPNGHYVVTTDAQGKEVATHDTGLKFPTNVSAPSSAKLRVRQLPPPDNQSGCDTGYVDPADLAHAQNDMNDCGCSGNSVDSDDEAVFKWNSVVAYVCSYGGTNPCSRGEADAAFNLIGQRCGFPAQGGWYHIPDWKKTYGYINSAGSFCTNL